MNRRTALSHLAVVGLALLGCHGSSPELKRLTVDEVDAKVAAHDGKTFVFDANSKDHYAEEHVPGAKWVPYDGVTQADLPSDKGATLIFYCANEL